MKLEEALKKSDEYHAVEINKLREVIEILRAENARYREALFKIMVTINDPKSILYQLSCEALGLDEPDEVYDYDGP